MDPEAVKRAETRRYGVKVYTVRELLTDAAERATSPEAEAGLTTGLWDLDDASGGIRRQFVWVFGADTSWGKTSWLVAVADENLQRGKRVLIVSSEDPPRLYGDRLMARRASVGAKRLRDRKLWPQEIEAVDRVAKQARPDPVYINAVSMPAEEVAEKVRRIVRDERIDLVAFDYLQSFTSSTKHQDRRNEIRMIAKAFSAAVKDSDAAGIIFSQITVDVSKKHPDKHSIRESRDVSNAAEVIVLGYEPTEHIADKNGDTKINAGTKAIWVDKIKDGPKGFAVATNWDSTSACFRPTVRPTSEQPPSEYDHLTDFSDNYSERVAP